jgi:hypothetical protein
LPLAVDCIKGNFDVVVKDSFVVAAAVISEDKGTIIAALMLELHSPDGLQGEALVALLAVQLATSLDYDCLLLGGDALFVVLAINNHSFFLLLGLVLIVFIILA